MHSEQAMLITADKAFKHIQPTQLDPPCLTPMGFLCRVGVQYLLDIWGGCWSDHQTDIENGEVGLSQAILADGYNIASMQHEYQGLDFRQQPDRVQCKGRLAGANPTFCCDTPGLHLFVFCFGFFSPIVFCFCVLCTLLSSAFMQGLQ